MVLQITSSRSLSFTRTTAIAVAMLVIVKIYTEMNHSLGKRLTTVTTKQIQNEEKCGYHPRVVHSCRSDCQESTGNGTKLRRVYELPQVLREVKGNEMSIARGKCQFKQDWQDRTYPTCNNVHEIDFFNMLQKIVNNDASKQVHYLGTGGSRDTWKIFDKHINNKNNHHNNTIHVPLAFKTLRIDREYIWPRIDHQRVDAIVSERLTASPHVVDIYGYCGTATINEFGEGGTLDHNILDNNNISPIQKLEYGRDIAYALADLHELDGYPSSTVQHDLKPKNVLVVANGKVKLGDFNNAHFLGKNTDQRCLFSFKQECQNMKITPHAQECQLGGYSTEKIEVFQLGFILHFLLMPNSFRQPLSNPPGGKNPTVPALRHAMEAAFTVKVAERPTAREIGYFLDEAISKSKSRLQ